MYKTNEVQSILVTGTMWDTVMKWLENNDVNVQTDSSEWANYLHVLVTGVSGYWIDGYKMVDESWKTEKNKPANIGAVLKTGASDFTKKKNIYDLAGNMWESTNEIRSSDGWIIRGNCCASRGSNNPAAIRSVQPTSQPDLHYTTFRVGLYIK